MNVGDAFEQFYASLTPSQVDRETTRERVRRLQPRPLRLSFPGPIQIGNISIVGSTIRDTDVRGVSDVDVMMELLSDSRNLIDTDSREIVHALENSLRETCEARSIQDRGEVVSIEYLDGAHIDIQPVIAVASAGYALPNGMGGWTKTDPILQGRFLQERVARAQVDLRDLIRGLKYWNFHQGSLLSSYHVEVIACQLSDRFSRPFSRANHEFFKSAQGLIHQSDSGTREAASLWPLSTSQLHQFAACLTEAQERSRSALRSERAGDAQLAISHWKAIFGPSFPTGQA